jgi:hypothetical protein
MARCHKNLFRRLGSIVPLTPLREAASARQILSQLGAGGIRKAWRARDTRHDRSLAVKGLRPASSGNH